MEEINRKFAENVRYIVKIKGLKIGDIESTLGLRAGYLSRKIDKDTSIPLELAYEFSSILGLTIDEVISFSIIDNEIKELEYEITSLDEEKDRIKKKLEEMKLQKEVGLGVC